MKKIFTILIILLFNFTLIAQNGAYLKIDSEPTGATIKLNGVKKGVTPCEIIVVPGSYTMIAQKDKDTIKDYFYTESIILKNSEIKKMSVTLTERYNAAYKKKLALIKKEITASLAYGSFTDERDSRTYKTVTIKGQTWLTEDLKYNPGYNWCPDNNSANCSSYGRLYNLPSSLTVCPKGWHLPSRAEFSKLLSNCGYSTELWAPTNVITPDNVDLIKIMNFNFNGYRYTNYQNNDYYDGMGQFSYYWINEPVTYKRAQGWNARFEVGTENGNKYVGLGTDARFNDTDRNDNPKNKVGYCIRCIKD